MDITTTTGVSAARVTALMADISKTFTDLDHALEGFSQEEFNRVPFAGSWTPGQVAEHLIKSIGLLPDGNLQEPKRPYDQYVKPISDMFLNFSVKFQSPPDVVPGDLPQDREEVRAVFRKKRERLEKTVQTCDLTKLCLDYEFPTVGALTRYEWIRFFLVHMRRHVHQLSEMRKKIDLDTQSNR